MVCSNVPGVAVAWGDSNDPPAGSIIGKCLVDKDTADLELVEVLIGRY